ncbi:MAG TPA: ATP phosphoribosyltransferase regulatory subunit [Pyrinomonadaceae bacterium]|nr:ATP phosphoribosyltransferase regulatory subunit [Acidobacteriota bacterium]HQZ95388.1 ATP phosphoribosyltransferase regulatory subunit [Pyrinomonadaceae bacterium]
MASTKAVTGIRDVEKRDHVTSVIKEICERYGFERLESGASFQVNIGSDDSSIEANAILAVNETLERLGVQNFAIYLSHSDVLASILETVRVPAKLRQKTFAAIRGFSKFNIEGFVAELQEAGVSENASTVLAELFLTTDEILNQERDINQTVVSNLLNIVNIDTLTELGAILRSTGRKPVFIDPALPCESPFDEGIVIETRTSGLDVLGEGGCIVRSDDETVFAFSFDIENIVELMAS